MKRWNQANLEIEDRQFHLDRHLWPEKTSCYKTIRKVPQTGLDILNKSTQAAPIEEEVRLVESGGCQALEDRFIKESTSILFIPRHVNFYPRLVVVG
ncbi:hypothetical protein RRG08_050365 [Elysia crispata]|uniref:Uncharacterized protein n=1 Tax=Elysia crispata TaxID=231223 RepID=A0AAE0YVV9_9GAST|nr:hypothetical protein RRG08_050365 [Elysia crispata]